MLNLMRRAKTKEKRIFPNYILGFLFVLTIGITAGCSSSDIADEVAGGGTPPVPTPTVPSPQQGTAAATSSVSGTTNNALGAVGKSLATSNTAVTNSILTILGQPLIPAGADPTSKIEEDFKVSLGVLFPANPTVDGNKLTFDPDEALMCVDPGLLAFFAHLANEYGFAKQCIDLYTHITLVLIFDTLTTINMMYDTNILTTIDIDDSAKSLTNRINLLFLRAIIGAMILDDFFNGAPMVPENWTGVVGFTATEFGEDNANIRWFVDEEIKIFDTAFKYDVTVPVMPNYLDVTANGNTGDLAFTTNILDGIVHGSPKKDIFGSNEFQTDIKWGPWDGSYNLGTDRDILVGVTSPITVTQDVKDPLASTDDPIDWKLELGNYQWNINGLTDTIQFTASYNAHFESNDVKSVVNKGQIGNFDVSKLSGTELKYVRNEDANLDPAIDWTNRNGNGETRFEVTAGAVNFLNGTLDYGILNNTFFSNSSSFTPGGTVSPNDVDSSINEVDTVTFDGFFPFQRTFKF